MLGFQELVLVLVIVLIIYGPGKLPKIGSALGQGIAEFKKASAQVNDPAPPRQISDSKSSSDSGDVTDSA